MFYVLNLYTYTVFLVRLSQNVNRKNSVFQNHKTVNCSFQSFQLQVKIGENCILLIINLSNCKHTMVLGNFPFYILENNIR